MNACECEFIYVCVKRKINFIWLRLYTIVVSIYCINAWKLCAAVMGKEPHKTDRRARVLPQRTIGRQDECRQLYRLYAIDTTSPLNLIYTYIYTIDRRKSAVNFELLQIASSFAFVIIFL